MKLAISVALLALLVGAPAYALQDPEREKEKPQPEEHKKPEPDRKQPAEKEREKPTQDRPQEKQPPRDAPRQDKEQTDRARPADRQQQQNEKQQQQADKQQQQPQRDGRIRDEHNNVQQAQRDSGNRSGRRIRDDDFRAHFGRQHAFRVSRRDDRRFNYEGYWFVYNDPWPAEWNYDDDVYVDELDGEYYLIDPVHPGMRLLVIVAD